MAVPIPGMGSFIAGHTGEKVAEAGRDQEMILVAGFDLDGIEDRRAQWGIFRDRRPCMYGRILTCDGTSKAALMANRQAADPSIE
ncbi:hypothetical protein [Thermacetogenium phaeum]|nr:hypothetical protein [Thermacetogenium phaeum]